MASIIKQVIIFTLTELIIFFIIFTTHAYVFKIPSISGALSKGGYELFTRLYMGQIPIQIILLTIIFYLTPQLKLAMVILAVILAYVISLSFWVSDFKHFLDSLKFLPIYGYINIPVMLAISAVLSVFILRSTILK